MTEQQIQYKITKRFEADGWLSCKVIKCNKSGWPDLMFFKDGKTLFIEVKAKNGRVSKLQEYRHEQLKEQGFEVLILRQ